MIPADTEGSQNLAHPGLDSNHGGKGTKDSSAGKVLDLEARGHQLDPRLMFLMNKC